MFYLEPSVISGNLYNRFDPSQKISHGLLQLPVTLYRFDQWVSLFVSIQ